MADKIQFRRDTAARWAEVNPILLSGEIGLVTDSENKYKLGDGVHTWNELPLQGFNGNIVDIPGTDTDSAMSQKGATDLVSEYNVSTNNNNAEYTLAQAVALVPVFLQKGGLTIKYIDSTTHKYAIKRLMSSTWNTTESNWQGIDDEPTAGSDNLVKSGGVANNLTELKQNVRELNAEIANAEIAFDDNISSTPVDILSNAKTNKYLKKNTAKVYDADSYNISAPIHLLKGQVLSALIIANDVTVLAETDSQGTTYKNIQNSVDFSNSITFVANKDIYVAVCYRTNDANTVSIISSDVTLADIADKVKVIDKINYEVNGNEINEYTPGAYLDSRDNVVADENAGYSDYIPYTQGNDVIWRCASETMSAFCILFYNSQKQFINNAYWSFAYTTAVHGRKITAGVITEYAPNAAYLRASFVLSYEDACVLIGNTIAWRKLTIETGLRQRVEHLETTLSDVELTTDNINNEIQKALIEYNHTETAVDFVTGAINGKYLAKDTAAVETYDTYSISAPIHLQKGQVLEGEIEANDVTVLAETDSQGSVYKNIQNNVGKYKTPIKYVAEKDIYVAVCYRTNSTISYLYIENADATLDEISKQVKDNTINIQSCIQDVPSFVIHEAEITFARFQKWKGSDECLVFPIITDLHANPTNPGSLKPNDYIVAVDRVFGFNHIANLGDVGLGNDSAPTEEKALVILNKTAESFNKYPGKYLFVQGNHDSDFKSLLGFGQVDINNYLACTPFNRYPNDYKINLGHQCYYIDNEALKIRIVCINTTDNEGGGGYAMSAEQLNWIYSTLLNTPNDYKVLVLSHFCVNKIGEWISYVSSSDYAYGANTELKAFAKMLEGFANKTLVTFETYSFDFSNVDSSIKLIANICGDSHFDAQLRMDETLSVLKKVNDELVPFDVSGNGVNYVITQGYGSISVAETPSWATHVYFNGNETVLFDVVAIKPNQGEMKLFRIGAGGSARDREFTF